MTIVIIIGILFVILIAIASNNSNESLTRKPIDRKEVEFNLKDYPNEYTFSVKAVHLEPYIYPVLNICKELDVITLIPEPDNTYDSDAIKVEDSGWHIGYVPAEETYEVHSIIKKEHIAYIQDLEKDGYVIVRVKIRYK